MAERKAPPNVVNASKRRNDVKNAGRPKRDSTPELHLSDGAVGSSNGQISNNASTGQNGPGALSAPVPNSASTSSNNIPDVAVIRSDDSRPVVADAPQGARSAASLAGNIDRNVTTSDNIQSVSGNAGGVSDNIFVSSDNVSTSVLDILSAITAVHKQYTEIRLSTTGLGVIAAPVREWEFKIIESLPLTFSVLHVGAKRTSYMVKLPYFQKDFSDIDGLLLAMNDALLKIIEDVFTIMRQPSPTHYHSRLLIPPSEIGIPTEDMGQGDYTPMQIYNMLADFGEVTQSNNPNISYVQVAERLPLGTLRGTALQYSMYDMPRFRDRAEAMYLSTIDGAVPNSYPSNLNNSVFFNCVVDPFNLNAIYNYVYRPVHLSHALLSEISIPEIKLVPATAGELIITAGQSLTKGSCVNMLTNITYNPSMDAEIAAFISTLISPGAINFDIDLTDLSEIDVSSAGLAVIAARLLLGYSKESRWNSLTHASVLTCDSIIARVGIEAKIFKAVFGAKSEYPLHRVAPTYPDRRGEYHLLATNASGAGWRDGGDHLLAPHPIDLPYRECQLRQKFCTHIDDLRDIDYDAAWLDCSAWKVMNGIDGFLSALVHNRQGKSPLAAFAPLLHPIATRLHGFFIAINDYNRRTWYTGLRLSERTAASMFANDKEHPLVITLHGRTLLFMMKSLCKDSVMPPKFSYWDVLKIECRLARDCVESYARSILWDAMLGYYNIMANTYSRKDRTTYIVPKDGPNTKKKYQVSWPQLKINACIALS